jgi:hypothetical protein
MAGLFKNIHFDRKSGSMYLWEYDPETKKTPTREPPTIESEIQATSAPHGKASSTS